MPQNSFVMPQNLFLNSKLKHRGRRLTLRGFYHPNAGKNGSTLENHLRKLLTRKGRRQKEKKNDSMAILL
jgi:hypothetical protein